MAECRCLVFGQRVGDVKFVVFVSAVSASDESLTMLHRRLRPCDEDDDADRNEEFRVVVVVVRMLFAVECCSVHVDDVSEAVVQRSSLALIRTILSAKGLPILTVVSGGSSVVAAAVGMLCSCDSLVGLLMLMLICMVCGLLAAVAVALWLLASSSSIEQGSFLSVSKNEIRKKVRP